LLISLQLIAGTDPSQSQNPAGVVGGSVEESLSVEKQVPLDNSSGSLDGSGVNGATRNPEAGSGGDSQVKNGEDEKNVGNGSSGGALPHKDPLRVEEILRQIFGGE
jgi:hypothetical protein